MSYWNQLLDKSILFSFGSVGFKRHQKAFKEDNFRSVKEKVICITGGTSGIGLATARELAKRGAVLHLIGRDEEKGKLSVEYLKNECENVEVYFHKLDMGESKKVEEWAINQAPNYIDVLINNAGAMPQKILRNQNDQESIFSSQVTGHFVLTRTLLNEEKMNPESRVIFVSSGGMYLKKLNLEDVHFKKKKYNAYQAYSNAKRSLVILNHLFADRFREEDCRFSAMHPGWVDTPALKSYMPWFYKIMTGQLRNSEQGADTILWLALTDDVYPSGQFWFDRKKAEEHLISWTKETEEEREALWNYCKSQ